MRWLSDLPATGYAMRFENLPARGPSGRKLTEKISVCLDYETQQRLTDTSKRLQIHHADLVRAFILKGLNQCL